MVGDAARLDHWAATLGTSTCQLSCRIAAGGADGPELDVGALMNPGDLYATLGVGPDADWAAIRAAYRTLARRHHPDIPGGSAAEMAAINAAWSVLRDPFTRKAYDRRRARFGARTSSDAVQAPSQPGSDEVVLDFGRYEGWAVDAVARHDPDYLDWLVRTPNGRRYRAAIEASRGRPSTASLAAPVRRARRGVFARSG